MISKKSEVQSPKILAATMVLEFIICRIGYVADALPRDPAWHVHITQLRDVPRRHFVKPGDRVPTFDRNYFAADRAVLGSCLARNRSRDYVRAVAVGVVRVDEVHHIGVGRRTRRTAR